MPKKGNKEEIVKGAGLTYEDYARLPEDGPRYELAGGKFVMLIKFTLLLHPLKNKAFLMLWVSQFLNVTGDAIFSVALGLFLLQRAHPAQDLGVVLGAVAFGAATSLMYGGVLADRFRKSRVLIVSDILRLLGVLGIIILGGKSSLILLGTLGLFIGIGEGLYRPTYSALIPEIIDEKNIRAANGLRSATNRVAAMIGAALGGVLAAAAGPSFALWVDVITFAVSIMILLLIRDSVHHRPDEESLLNSAISGLSYVIHRPWMSAIILQGMLQVAFVVAPVTILLPLVFGQVHSELYGITLSVEAFGAFLGSFMGASFISSRPGLYAMIALMLQVPQLVILASGFHVWLLVPSSFLTGFGLSAFGVIWITSLQLITPREKLGRVLSIDALGNSVISPLGFILVGYLLPLVGFQFVAWFALGVLVTSILGALLIPGVIELGGGLKNSGLGESHG
ncbi:MAG: MFS transporter [Candidatus Carbobacillus altaicus]|nr:MFS transporter [Candidatus Carbobacillus altaicus]